jgi:hypothetical protein
MACWAVRPLMPAISFLRQFECKSSSLNLKGGSNSSSQLRPAIHRWTTAVARCRPDVAPLVLGQAVFGSRQVAQWRRRPKSSAMWTDLRMSSEGVIS